MMLTAPASIATASPLLEAPAALWNLLFLLLLVDLVILSVA
jgi:hypothetical protein